MALAATSNDLVFTDEELTVDERLGYPEAYAKLCRNRALGPFSHGPPITFIPYELPHQEDLRGKEMDDMFPEIDPKLKATTKPKIFVNLLWKQLNHLGKAGFDPDVIRVDPYGNVVHYHADEASPLAWEIDHWFPCSRGGLTVPSNLRILQCQVCRRKLNKLEFLIPWWDFQMGISINQFLSIFASSNSDFRRRGFSWLFSEGECHELHSSQTVDCHIFPQHFLESERKLGMASAALVLCKKEPFDAPLKSLDFNRKPRSSTPIVAVKKIKQYPKENEDPIRCVNPYQAIAMARDSLKQKEEEAKMQEEMQKLDQEVNELQQRTEEEKMSIQELEIILMKKRRRAEKCRHLSESQSSYRVMLEKMIRDAMHQSVVYKEQVRLNQAAASALLARLEAQKALCDSAERELIKKSKQRDELEKQQIVPEIKQARKRSRMDDTPPHHPETEPNFRLQNTVNDSPSDKIRSTPHKELRKLLEEEKRALEVEGERERENEITVLEPNGNNGTGEITEERDEKAKPDEEENEESRRERGKGNIEKWLQFLLQASQQEDSIDLLNIEIPDETGNKKSKELAKKLNLKYPLCKESPERPAKFDRHCEKEEETIEIEAQKKKKNGRRKITFDVNPEGSSKTSSLKEPPYRIVAEKMKEQTPVSMDKSVRRLSSPDDRIMAETKREQTPVSIVKSVRRLSSPDDRIMAEKKREQKPVSIVRRMSSPDDRVRMNKISRERELLRSESARAFRRIPSSPSVILGGMKKGVDCLGKKPSVLDDITIDEGHEPELSRHSFIKSSLKAMKKVIMN